MRTQDPVPQDSGQPSKYLNIKNVSSFDKTKSLKILAGNIYIYIYIYIYIPI